MIIMKKLSRNQLLGLFILSIGFIAAGVIGRVLSSYVTTMLGFTISAFLFIYLGLVLRSDKENPEILTTPVLWFLRFLSIAFGIFILGVFIPFWRDFPEYINKEYIELEGYPTYVDYELGGWSRYEEPELHVTIEGKELYLEIYPENPEELYDKYFTIQYLPETEWIISLDMK
ncbi:hypothetical protein DYI25_13335 [Mesobacillus boroniphilus]|uniref:Uncharacterized protein n=1 Tax=Mesobacillus boroniphilus TaxID=308892 RepID=A0A944GY45_9BACI|nr:hypothetical protein [Mesobacillus boroniphilus]MBS8265405.1 hypothetical protein [Mesobacillus boroniphilus]